MVNNISGGFVPLPDPVVVYKQLLREAVERFLDENGVTTDFTPKKFITKHKL